MQRIQMASKSRITILVTAMFVPAVIIALLPNSSEANPSIFTTKCETAEATTTRSTINTHSGTTTLECNLADGGNSADEVVLLVYRQASTTATVNRIAFEYSQDGSSWFVASTGPTTSSVIPVANTNFFRWAFASTSMAGQGIPKVGDANGDKDSILITVPTYTAYVRASIYGDTATSSIWMAFVSKKELR